MLKNWLYFITKPEVAMEMPIPNAAVLGRKTAITALLQAALPADAVITDPAETLAYACDALSEYSCTPLAVVFTPSLVLFSARNLSASRLLSIEAMESFWCWMPIIRT